MSEWSRSVAEWSEAKRSEVTRNKARRMNTAVRMVKHLQHHYEAQKKPATRNEMKLSGWIFFVLNGRVFTSKFFFFTARSSA
jgi:hypothetical protein